MPQSCHCLEEIGNSPIHLCRPLSTLMGMVILVVCYCYLWELGALSIWSLKERNWWKQKLDHLKNHDCSETVTKHMIFPFIEIPCKPSAGTLLRLRQVMMASGLTRWVCHMRQHPCMLPGELRWEEVDPPQKLVRYSWLARTNNWYTM